MTLTPSYERPSDPENCIVFPFLPTFHLNHSLPDQFRFTSQCVDLFFQFKENSYHLNGKLTYFSKLSFKSTNFDSHIYIYVRPTLTVWCVFFIDI